MMTTSPRLLASVILAVLVLAVGALVFRGADDKGSADTGSTDNAQGVGGDGQATDPAQAAAAAEAAAGLAPAGTYRYRVERRPSGGQPQVYESSLAVAGTGSQRTEERDHVGTRVRRDFALRDASRMEMAMVLLNGAYEGRCDWAPDVPTLLTPLEVGRTWKADGSCRLPVVNGQVDVKLHEDVRVAATETITVAGASLQAVRIDRTTKLTSTVDGKRTTRSTQRAEWFSPAHGLMVRSVERVTESGDGPAQSYETIEELLGLAPT